MEDKQPSELEKELIVNIAHLMIGKEYPNVGQIVEAILPTIHKACNQSSDYQPKSNTHCRRGHEYTPDNTLIRRREMGGRLYKYRSCRACNRLRWHYNKELRTKQGIK